MIRYWRSIGKEPETLSSGWWITKTEYSLTELFEMTEISVGIFPDRVLNLVFCKNASEVRNKYMSKYGRRLRSHSFMSRSQLTAWFSLEDITPQVFVHEIAHLLLEVNSISSVGSKIHEVVAQWAEKEVLK